MMLEGEPRTPVVRVPDEETAFVGRTVEAPKRRLKQQQQAKKKRLAVLAVSAVTVVAFGTVCAFLTLPSDSSGEVKTAVSQAMESDPATANAGQVFVPSFDVYDEDGDGKVSLGEYLDRLSVNRDAALEKVTASSLDDSEKTRIADLLNEDCDNHLVCVVHIAQEHHDDVIMSKDNFDQIYNAITTEFCPVHDDRILDAYQLKEIAAGQEEITPDVESSDLWDSSIEASSTSTSESYSGSGPTYESASSSGNGHSDSESYSGSEYNSVGVSSSNSESYSESGSAGSSSVDDKSQSEADWKPEDPDLPPRPIPSGDTATEDGIAGSQPGEDKLWSPSYPTDPPVPSTTDKKPSEWKPDPPYYPPVPSTTSAPGEETTWNPDKPTNPSRVASSAAGDEQDDRSPSNPEKRWTPTEPTNPPKTETDQPKTGKQWSPDLPTYPPVSSDKAAALSSDNGEWNPEESAQKYPTASETAPDAEQATGIYNAYTGTANTGAYNTYPGAANTGAPKAYTRAADTGAPNTYTSTYNAYPGASNSYSNGYPGAANTGVPSAYPGASNTYSNGYPDAANTGAPSAYTGAADTGASNTYTGAFNGYPDAAYTIAPNANTGATNTGAYNSYTGAGTTYGTSAPTKSFPETKAQGYPATEREQATDAYNADAYTTGAYNSYTGTGTTYGTSAPTKSFPEM